MNEFTLVAGLYVAIWQSWMMDEHIDAVSLGSWSCAESVDSFERAAVL